jgi:cytochrome c553
MNKSSCLAVAIVVSVLVAACSQPERSRALDNPRVPAVTVAQQVCSMCHGMTGNSRSPAFPKLAGQSRDYLIAQLAEFKSHSRSTLAGEQSMWGVSRLSPAQVESLADFYSSQAPTYQPVADAGLAAQGRRIYSEGIPDKGVPACAACHGMQGEGVGQFPRLAGQHADYLSKQLVIFRQTQERPLGVAMQPIAHGLTDPQIHAIAVFLQSFSPPVR